MRIAVCEADTPTPERDAGSRAVMDLVTGLHDLGHEVLLALEAEPGLPDRVADFGPDVIVISRPGLFARLAPGLRGLGAPLVFFAHDLHFVRVGLQHEQQHGTAGAAARVMRLVEERCYTSADLCLLPTREELELVRREFPSSRSVAIDYFALSGPATPPEPPRSLRLVFVGSSAHAPNDDGVRWFAREVWPRVRAAHPDAELVVAGAWPDPAELASIAGLRLAGNLPDAELDALLASARIGIAPLRFGAGMKRKTVHYLSLGLPVVGTGFAVEGLRGEDGTTPGVALAESPEQWLAAIDALAPGADAGAIDALAPATDPGAADSPAPGADAGAGDALWRDRSQAGWAFVRDRFSPERYRSGLAEALRALR